jgi:hypothetical protein
MTTSEEKSFSFLPAYQKQAMETQIIITEHPELLPPLPDVLPPWVLSAECEALLSQRPLAAKEVPFLWKPEGFDAVEKEMNTLWKDNSPITMEHDFYHNQTRSPFNMPTRILKNVSERIIRDETEEEFNYRVGREMEKYNKWRPEPQWCARMKYNDHDYKDVIAFLKKKKTPLFQQMLEAVKRRKVVMDDINKSRDHPIRTTYIVITLKPLEQYFEMTWDIHYERVKQVHHLLQTSSHKTVEVENVVSKHYSTEYILHFADGELKEFKSQNTLKREEQERKDKADVEAKKAEKTKATDAVEALKRSKTRGELMAERKVLMKQNKEDPRIALLTKVINLKKKEIDEAGWDMSKQIRAIEAKMRGVVGYNISLEAFLELKKNEPYKSQFDAIIAKFEKQKIENHW